MNSYLLESNDEVALQKTINELSNNTYENVNLFNFYNEMKTDYVMLDGIHLNKKGNEAFINFIKSNLN